MMSNWKYYNHAYLPNIAPHKEVSIEELSSREMWKSNKNALFARWTSDFDCEKETNWWYVIKDDVFDITKLKSKRRYEINKGIKNFNVNIIEPQNYKEEIFEIQKQAYSEYPEKYRPKLVYDKVSDAIDKWDKFVVYGAFDIEENQLCGYILIEKKETYIDFAVLKVIPRYEKKGINAALVYGMLQDNNEFLRDGKYICDGERSLYHETAFQDYLEKYFEFRKAYCRLHIMYRKNIRVVINGLYNFRRCFNRFNKNSVICKINSILKMEEIVRSFQ